MNQLHTASNLVWQSPQTTPEHRRDLLKQYPVTLWMTGLSGAGKSTLAFALEKRLISQGHACFVLDGDNVRHGLNRDLDFSPHARTENIRRVAEVAKLMNSAGLIVISSFISPYREDRGAARDIIGNEAFLEIHISTALQDCERRDPKGLYQKARAGLISDFTGISAPYEPPLTPALSIDTSSSTVDSCIERMLKLVEPFLIRDNESRCGGS
ncbi:adenylyl-sulfate kinase [Ectopseudomonas hydrolytica]|uniref:Adenylyl-sulfate kinase n=1 Tax=Ectopseudomonas hydrolytica TaxID=2493633 RepID=A0ABY5A783_9GAMM|nr:MULTISPECIES: adenylyl-sulfate kinase [Pseudomonas]MDH0098714.1 adenylyl-sulfate kinase [Pseudomonas sp. GD04158]USR39683.1 adenylyl-sulfate kinase [Pseudomonas hydrolytica]